MALQFKGGKATPVNAKKPAPFMRQPVLKLGDGIYATEPTIGELGDQEVAAAFRELKQAYSKFVGILDRKAIWD